MFFPTNVGERNEYSTIQLMCTTAYMVIETADHGLIFTQTWEHIHDVFAGCSSLLYQVSLFDHFHLPSAFSALTLLVGRQEGHPACKKTEWWCVGVVVCLERGADLHTAQRMPLPLTVICFSKIHIGFTFLVPAHLGSPWQRAVKRV